MRFRLRQLAQDGATNGQALVYNTSLGIWQPGTITSGGGGGGTYDATEARVTTAESTTSGSYTDLATAGPAVTVTIGSTGKALVTLTASVKSASAGVYAVAGFAVSGATTRAPSDTDAIYVQGTSEILVSRTVVVSGLTPGSTTFTMKYYGGSGTFQRRAISVLPF